MWCLHKLKTDYCSISKSSAIFAIAVGFRNFCLYCWKEINVQANRCKCCDYDLKAYENLSYEKKLINSLHQNLF
jgi:hypothetical protein